MTIRKDNETTSFIIMAILPITAILTDNLGLESIENRFSKNCFLRYLVLQKMQKPVIS